MAKKKRAIKLSVSEMRLMAVLWRLGPQKLSEVFREQPGHVGYTTIQTQLNRLVDKGVASRSSTRPTRYKALIEPDAASAVMLQLLIDTVGCGSIVPLIEQLVRIYPPSKDDASALKKIIDQVGRKKVLKNKVTRTTKST